MLKKDDQWVIFYNLTISQLNSLNLYIAWEWLKTEAGLLLVVHENICVYKDGHFFLFITVHLFMLNRVTFPQLLFSSSEVQNTIKPGLHTYS